MRMMHLLLISILLLSQSAQSYANPALSGKVQHVVLLWLKTPGSSADIEAISNATESFTSIPGVKALHIGRAVQSERAIVDDSFDLGISIDFETAEAMQHYLRHPIHRHAVEEILKPRVARILVYDIQR